MENSAESNKKFSKEKKVEDNVTEDNKEKCVVEVKCEENRTFANKGLVRSQCLDNDDKETSSNDSAKEIANLLLQN